MHTVIRTYLNQPELADTLKKHRKDIEQTMGAISGFVSYTIIKIPDGAVALTTCETRAGCEDSSKRAGEWLRQNLPQLKVKPPVVVQVEVCVQFAKAHAGV